MRSIVNRSAPLLSRDASSSEGAWIRLSSLNRTSIDHDFSLPYNYLRQTALSALAFDRLVSFLKSSLSFDSVEGILNPSDLMAHLIVLLHDLVHLCELLLHPLIYDPHSITVHLCLRIDLLIECDYIQCQFFTHLMHIFDHVISQVT